MLSNLSAIAILVLLGGAVACLVGYRLQRYRLYQIVKGLIGRELNDEKATLALARFIFSKVTRNRDPIFLLQILQPFGGSPLAILRNGGCCSGTHRLFIACLDTLDIPAAQITLYHRSGCWCHCLVQVSLDEGYLLMDVDYGVQYMDAGGEPLDLADLQSGVPPSIRVIAEGLEAPLCEGYIRDPRPGYPLNDYYDFDFKQTRTANWAKTRARRLLYRILFLLTRGQIDRTLVSPVLEWPQMILAVCLSAMAVLLLLVRHVLPV